MNMQGLHHHKQQLVALLSVALPKDPTDSPSSKPNPPPPKSLPDDSSRLAAITSLHRAIVYPTTRTFPASLSSLFGVYRLDLSCNDFSGEIPVMVNWMNKLLTLRLEDNGFNRSIQVLDLHYKSLILPLYDWI